MHFLFNPSTEYNVCKYNQELRTIENYRALRTIEPFYQCQEETEHLENADVIFSL